VGAGRRQDHAVERVGEGVPAGFSGQERDRVSDGQDVDVDLGVGKDGVEGGELVGGDGVGALVRCVPDVDQRDRRDVEAVAVVGSLEKVRGRFFRAEDRRPATR
jgi:hypothetical protein